MPASAGGHYWNPALPEGRLMDQQYAASFFPGGGATGDLMRPLDWSASPLGHPSTWPQSLRSVVGLVLTSKFPMFVAWGAELGFLYNDAYAEILGDKHPVVLGQRFHDIWAEIWSDISPLIEAALAGEAVYREDLPLVVNRNGTDEQAWFTFSYSPVRDEAGQVAGMFCAVAETTGKVLADQRNGFLIELGDRIRDLLDPQAVMAAASEVLGRRLGAARAGYGEVETDGVHVNVEGGWQAENVAPVTGSHRLSDYGEAFVREYRTGRTVAVFDFGTDPRSTAGSTTMHAAFGARAQLVVPLVKAGRLAALLFVHSSTRRCWTGADQALVEDIAERTWAAVERARAVTALHASETRLRELNETLESQVEARTRELARSEARFRAYFDASPECLFLARVPLDSGLVFEDLNPAGEQLYGLPRSAIVGHAATAVLDPEMAADVERLARECLLLDQPLRYETVRTFQFGRTFVLNIVAAPLPTSAADDPLVLFCKRDVTEQRKSEEALRQAQKMEAVGQLTGGIAHDFNNMLQAISGNLELMRRRVDQERTEDLPRHLDNASATVARAAALTQRLLAFSRRQTLQPKQVDVDKLVSGMMELISRTVGPDISVELHGGSGNWLVLCDPNQLESALLNLTINARDAMPDGGKLIFAAQHVQMSHADLAGHDGGRPGVYVEIAVTDTGIGMDKATQGRVFEPFFTTKPVGQGTGLGLSQLYGFVQQSGGQVRLESAPGRGTTVRLLLPGQEGKQEPNGSFQADMPSEQPSASGTVLLVEDEAGVRAVAAEFLRELGYQVLEAEDGPAVLRMLRSGARMDILVTDVGLPGGMNGRQVAEIVRERRPGLPTLFVTGYAGEILAGQLAAGMEVIGKPFALDALATKVRSMMIEN